MIVSPSQLYRRRRAAASRTFETASGRPAPALLFVDAPNVTGSVVAGSIGRADLDPAQRAMLEAWGYPYVLDTFKFHITLTGNLADADLTAARARIESLGAGRLDRPMPVDAVTVYAQPAPDTPFLVARHYGFDGATRDGAGARYLPPATDVAR